MTVVPCDPTCTELSCTRCDLPGPDDMDRSNAAALAHRAAGTGQAAPTDESRRLAWPELAEPMGMDE